MEQASLSLERDLLNEESEKKWINMLIAPGASLGGARPKAIVLDEKGHLWISKFPSVNDTHNVGAWEMLANDLAKHAGITMAEGIVKKYNSKHLTYLSKRFDKTSTGERVHFASAMTLLGHSDGAAGVSYLHLAEFIMRHGAMAATDLKQIIASVMSWPAK